MKRILIITAALLAAATPLLAETQLERSSGSEAGRYSTAVLAALHFEQSRDGGDGPRLHIRGGTGGLTVSTSNATSDTADFARRHFDQSHEGGDGARYFRAPDNGNPLVLSTSNADLAALAAAKLDTHERGDN